MDTSMLLALALVFLVFVWYNYYRYRPSGKVVPGPDGWSLLGSTRDFASAGRTGKLGEYFVSLQERYGDIAQIRVGMMTIIIISSGKLLKRLFAKDEFADKPLAQLSFMSELNGGRTDTGITFNNSHGHAKMRKLALATFRDLGVGKKALDESVHAECSYFCQYLESVADENTGIVTDLKDKIQKCTVNIIHDVVLGFRYDYKDGKLIQMVEKMSNFFSINRYSFPEVYIPALKYLKMIPVLKNLLKRKEMQPFFAGNEYLRKYLMHHIKEHRTTYVDGELRDFIDLYIQQESNSSIDSDNENLFATIVDIFRAGSDTTATGLAWCLHYLMKYPDIQEELRREIDEKIGDQMFQRKDKDLLVKTQAFINEVLRMSAVAVATPPHLLQKAAQVEEYLLPEGALVIGNLFGMQYDQKYWENPEQFQIKRWIDKEGQLLQHDDYFIPFSTGKRVCVGRQIAGIELILFLVQILQRFKFEKVPGTGEICSNNIGGQLRTPPNHPFKITKRM